MSHDADSPSSHDDEEARRVQLAELSEAEAAPALVAALGDESWRVRKEAVERIAGWPRPHEVVGPLVALLDEEADVGARNAAVEALAALGPTCTQPLVEALERAASATRRKFVLDALGAVGDPAAVGAVVGRLDDPHEADENVRVAAAEALGRLGGPTATQALAAALGLPGLYTRLAALDALVLLGARLPLGAVLPLLDTPTLRPAATLALGQTGDVDALPHLLDALTDKARSVRIAAIVSLFELHVEHTDRQLLEASVRAAPAAAVAGLVAALHDESPRVRRAAATLLGWGRWPEALEPLAATLVDEEVAEAAARAIVAFGAHAIAPLVGVARGAGQALRGEIFRLFPRFGAAAADARVAGLLERALADEDPATAATAARALGEVGGKDALGPLFHALERGDDPMVAAAAGQALAKLGARFRDEVRMLIGARGLEGRVGPHLCRVIGAVGRAGDRPLLLAAVGESDPALRQAAAAALALLGAAPESVEALVYALVDEDARVRAAAAEGLGGFADAGALEALLSASGDADPHVAAASARALGQIGDAAAGPVLTALARGPAGPVAADALEALGRLPGEVDVPLFTAALARGDAELAKAAVRALTGRAGAAATRILAGAVGHGRWDVRRLAVQALAGRGGNPTVRAALAARADVETDPLVREALAAALGTAAPGV